MSIAVSYQKVGKIGGIVGTNKGRYAIVGNEGASYNVAFLPFCSNKLFLNSYFISGYKGGNYAGQKGVAHYTSEMLKVVKKLDSSFCLDKNHKPKSKFCKIIVKDFATAKSIRSENGN